MLFDHVPPLVSLEGDKMNKNYLSQPKKVVLCAMSRACVRLCVFECVL